MKVHLQGFGSSNACMFGCVRLPGKLQQSIEFNKNKAIGVVVISAFTNIET